MTIVTQSQHIKERNPGITLGRLTSYLHKKFNWDEVSLYSNVQ